MHVGPFKLVEQIGSGGMASVWSGVHGALGTPVALKFMRPGRDRLEDTLSFLNEARSLARMNHPGIVQVYDAGLCPADIAEDMPGVEAHSPYFVMEHAGRGMLSVDHIDTWNTTRSLLLGILDALAHAHARDVIHRDIKPSNILVDDDGAVRLTDFGIARIVGRDSDDRTELVRGTPGYMAPESVATSAPPEGPWTDLYAVGCLVYWMTTGSPPFSGEPDALLSAHLNDTPPALEPRFDVPDGLHDLCRKLLRKEPLGRFTRAADAARALADLPRINPGATPPPVPVQAVPTMPLATIVDRVSATEFDTDPGLASTHRAPRPPKDWRMPTRPGARAALATGPGLLDFRESSLLGREDQRDTLWLLLNHTWAGADITVGLQGPTGIGRKALADWFARRSHEVGATTVLSFDEDPQASMMRHLEAWCRRVGGVEGVEASFRRAGTWSQTHWDRTHLRRLAIDGETSDAALPAVYGRWTAHLSTERVVLMLATPDVLPLFERMRASQSGRRMLLVAADSEHSVDADICLGPLPTHLLEQLLGERFGFSESAAAQLARAAEGNPGVAMRWARTAIRDGRVEQTATGLALTPEQIEALTGEAEDWRHRLQAIVGDRAAHSRLLGLTAMVEGFVYNDEFEAISAVCGVDSSPLLASLFDGGILNVDGDTVRFSHPDARRSMLEWYAPEPSDYRDLADALGSLHETSRRIRLIAIARLEAGTMQPDEAGRRAHRLRVTGAVDEALHVLRMARSQADSIDHELALLEEQVECHLSRQSYAKARAALDSSKRRNASLTALELFLEHRAGEDVREAILDVETEGLSETATRMVAYAWTDIGHYEGARTLLMQLEPELDQPGKYYALSRLAFLQKQWKQTEQWGLRAAEGFVQDDRPRGRLAALDMVASARIELGQLESAIDDYRTILREAERLQAASWPYRCNLAVALLRRDEPPTEVDHHLQSVVAECIDAGRRDVEHYARVAQVFYALARSKRALAEQRMAAVEKMGVGPWMIDDVVPMLERARQRAESKDLERRIDALLVSIASESS